MTRDTKHAQPTQHPQFQHGRRVGHYLLYSLGCERKVYMAEDTHPSQSHTFPKWVKVRREYSNISLSKTGTGNFANTKISKNKIGVANLTSTTVKDCLHECNRLPTRRFHERKMPGRPPCPRTGKDATCTEQHIVLVVRRH